MFKIRICSDLDHEEIVADICWNNHTIATINQDKGLENLEVALLSPINQEPFIFSFDEMIHAFLDAKSKLHKMKKLD